MTCSIVFFVIFVYCELLLSERLCVCMYRYGMVAVHAHVCVLILCFTLSSN